MKRIVAIILCLSVLFLCGCGAKKTDKELAESCIDKSVEELYELIGKPESSDYSKSCLGEGDDGNLSYDGFVVYTYREGDTETVYYVE